MGSETDPETFESEEEAHEAWDASASIYERMIAIIGELPAIGKGAWNEQQKFHYRSHDDVLNALNPLLAKYGVFMVPRVMERIEGRRTTRGGGTLYEVNLRVEYTFYGAGGDSFVASSWGEGTDSGDKSTNKAMTMALKNVIAQAFAISTQEAASYDTDQHVDPETVAAFDPGKHVRDDAVPRGDDFVRLLGEQLGAIGPDVLWAETLAGPLRERFHVETRQELEGERLAEYWRRLANFGARMAAENDLSAFPPVSDQIIREGLAWAFGTDGTKITIERQPAEPIPPAGDEAPAENAAEIPWVDDVREALKQEEEAAADEPEPGSSS